MRVREMKEREDFLPILCRTLESGFALRTGAPARVEPPVHSGRQTWLLQPLLSACYVPGLAAPVRAFLRDSLAFTSVRHRAPFQLALGVGLSSPWGLRLAARPCFSVDPPLADTSHLLVVPGNLRVRIYDFRAGLCLVVLKHGFPTDSMQREIEARGEAGRLSLPLRAHADDFSWFEEPIFDGYSLARCPARLNRTRLEERTLELMARWTARALRTEPARVWVEGRLARVEVLARSLRGRAADRLSTLCCFAEGLGRAATQLGEITSGPTHGDLQPGNVLVSRDGEDLRVIDWEHSAERFVHYDALVFALGARAGSPIVDRAERFVAGDPKVGSGLPRQEPWRRAALAAFLLDDLIWFTEAMVGKPFLQESSGWRMRLDRAGRLLRLVRGACA